MHLQIFRPAPTQQTGDPGPQVEQPSARRPVIYGSQIDEGINEAVYPIESASPAVQTVRPGQPGDARLNPTC